MTGILDTLTGIAPDAGALGSLSADMGAVAGRVVDLPTGSIQQLLSLAAQISVPDQQALFGGSATGLATLSQSLRTPDELWAAITTPLGQLEASLDAGLRSPVTSAFEQLRGIGGTAPEDPAAALSSLLQPLRQAADLLLERPELQVVADFLARVAEIRAQLEAAPGQLATLVREQIQAALDEALRLVSPQLRHLEGFLDALEADMAATTLQSRLEELLLRLSPAGDSPLLATIGTLDFTDEGAAAALDGQLRAAGLLLRTLAAELQARTENAAARAVLFDVDAWKQRLRSAATAAEGLQVTDISDLVAAWHQGLEQAGDFVAGLSLDEALRPLRELTAQLGPQLEAFDIAQLQGSLQEALQGATSVVDTIGEAQLTVLAGLQNLANRITQAVEAVDLDAAVQAVENALASVDSAVTQLEALSDTLSTELQATLGDVRIQLEALRLDLTDPAGAYRSAFEGYLAAIRDAVPDNIPESLEQIGSELGSSLAALDQVAFDPVFDSVAGELDAMRAELEKIDSESLNALLQAALTAALAIFETFDFQAEVEEVLVTRFDEAVASVSDPVIEELQQYVDEVIDFLRAQDPARLFEATGIGSAYEEMVAQLNAFRPSAALQPVVDEVRRATGALEGFTPSRILQPVLAPLDQLRNGVQGLSLEPIFARLQQTLLRLTVLLDELDLAPLLEQLDAAVERVRQQLAGLLDIDGLLDALRPVHTALMDALDNLDPSALLQPLQAARQTILDAIDAADATALQEAFDAIAATVASVRLQSVRDQTLSRLQAMTAALATLDLPGRLSALRGAQQALRAALEARGEQADPAAEERRQRMLATVRAMDPLPVLAAGAEALATLRSRLRELTVQLEAALRDGGPLQQPLESLGARLQQLALGATGDAADLKQALRDVVSQAIGGQQVDALVQLFEQVRATFASYGPDNVEAAIGDLLAPLRATLDALPTPSEALADVVATFNDVRALLDPGLSDFLDQVRAEVEPVLGAVVAKVAELDPAAALGALDVRYAEVLVLRDRLLNRLQGLLDALNAPYQEIVQLLDDLNPAVVLVAPLSATYQEILAKVEGVNVRAVFQPLLDALARLRDELLAGIRRTGDAFEGFLRSAAPLSGSVSI